MGGLVSQGRRRETRHKIRDDPLHCQKMLEKEDSEVDVCNLNESGVGKGTGREVVILERNLETSREQVQGIERRRLEKEELVEQVRVFEEIEEDEPRLYSKEMNSLPVLMVINVPNDQGTGLDNLINVPVNVSDRNEV